MLLIEHKAIHLRRINAYAEYCWSVDAYGAYQPASFIYLCFESFSELCQEYGLYLFEPDKQPLQGLGFISRIETLENVQEIKKALSSGKNVLASLPNEIIGIYYQGDKSRLDVAITAARELGIENAETKIDGSVTYSGEILRWEEIQVEGNGRLLVINDAFLSDGFFMPKYGKSDENSRILAQLAREFSIFKRKLVRVEFRNKVAIWPCHEPISFIIEITNHGPNIENATVSLDLGEGYEPISPIERDISNLNTLSKTSFAFQVVPRIDGKYTQPIKVNVSANGDPITAVADEWSLEVTPSFGSATRSHTKQDDNTLSRLLTIFKGTNLYGEVETLPDLIRIDIKACLNRMRSVSERLIYLVLDKKGVTLTQRNFATAIQAAQTNKILSSRSIGYLHTVRVIGNLASHPSGEPLTDTDVRIVSYSLSCIMEELIDKNLL
jgi:hypothetical protein